MLKSGNCVPCPSSLTDCLTCTYTVGASPAAVCTHCINNKIPDPTNKSIIFLNKIIQPVFLVLILLNLLIKLHKFVRIV